MIELELRSYGSSDVVDLETWRPDRPDEFRFVLDMTIGVVGKPGADLFYVTVISEHFARQAHIRGRGQPLLVVPEFDLDDILQRVQRIIRHAQRINWHDTVEALCAHFDYEYADYQP